MSPSDFTTEITNPYLSLPVGQKLVYEAETEDGLERIEILIPGWTRNVAGVETLVFWDRVYLDGELVVEVSPTFSALSDITTLDTTGSVVSIV